MLIKQIQFTKCTDEEIDLVSEFLDWFCDQLYSKLNTLINRRKIQLRINYMLNVPWIHWVDKTKYLDIQTIMNCIYESFDCEEHDLNLWVINTNANIIIPKTRTSIERVIRFLEFGDLKYNATGMFNKIKQDYNYNKINHLWKLFLLNNGIGITESELLIDK